MVYSRAFTVGKSEQADRRILTHFRHLPNRWVVPESDRSSSPRLIRPRCRLARSCALWFSTWRDYCRTLNIEWAVYAIGHLSRPKLNLFHVDLLQVFGAGPVGLMAAYSALIRGASAVYVVDRVPERLAKAKEMGAIPIDFSKSDAVEQIEKLNGGLVDRAVDAVGYQAVNNSGDKEEPNIVLANLIRVSRMSAPARVICPLGPCLGRLGAIWPPAAEDCCPCLTPGNETNWWPGYPRSLRTFR